MLRDHQRLGGHDAGDDGLRGIEVFLQEHGRDGQHVADVVETVPGVVRGKLLQGVEFHADQLLDGVAVIHPVEPAHGDPAGIGPERVEAERVALDPGGQLLDLLLRQRILVGRRHDMGPRVLQHAQPELVVPEVGLGPEFVERHLALRLAVTVAAVAVLLQHRLDVLLEGIHDRLRRPGTGRQEQNQGIFRRQKHGVCWVSKLASAHIANSCD